MELGPQNHTRDGLLVPNSIMVVFMDPLGRIVKLSHHHGADFGAPKKPNKP